MSYGLDDTGFVPATVEDLRDEMNADILADVDADLDLDPDQPAGQFVGIFASKLSEAWELLDTVVKALDDNSAEDSLLDNLAAMTGTKRPAAKKGKVTIRCTLAGGTVMAGTAQVADVADATNTWTIEESYTAGASPETKDLTFVCDREGVVLAPAGTLTVITTPIAGWSAATNPTDAVPGRLVAKDLELRQLRRQELADLGATSLPALRSALLKVEGVIAALCEENTSMAVDAYGRPAKSIEAIIWDGVALDALDQDLAKTIFENTAGGIESYGTTATVVYVDEYEVNHTIRFTRATQVPITVSITLTQDPKLPAYNPVTVRQAIVDYGNSLGGNEDPIIERVKAVALAVAGVKDVVACTLDRGSGPVATNISIGKREVSTWDTGDVTVL